MDAGQPRAHLDRRSAPPRGSRCTGADGTVTAHAIGVAEVIGAEDDHDTRAVLTALVAQGVTATCTRPDGPRYGALDVDSNLPDVRVVLGGPDQRLRRTVLAAAGPAYPAALERPRPGVRARRPAPRADLGAGRRPARRPRPAGAHRRRRRSRTCAPTSADSDIEVPVPAGLPGTAEPAAGHSVALLNAGTPGTVAKHGEAVYLNLMRACSTWPSGVWIDGPQRTAPTGRACPGSTGATPSATPWWPVRATGAGQVRSRRAGVQPRRPAARGDRAPRRAAGPYRPGHGRAGDRAAGHAQARREPARRRPARTPPARRDGARVRVRGPRRRGPDRPVHRRLSGARSATRWRPTAGADLDAGRLTLGPADVATLRLRPAGERLGARRGSGPHANRPSRCSPATGCTTRDPRRWGTSPPPCTCPPHA